MTSLAPFWIFFAGAAVVAVTGGRLRQAVLLAIPVVGAVNLFYLTDGTVASTELFSYTLNVVRVDTLSMFFGYLFHLAALIAVIYALGVRDTTQQIAAIVYAGSALGAVFAGDLITLFVFWELLALSSVFLILARRTDKSQKSAMRYLVFQVGSGVILLAGVLIRAHETGSIAFDYIGLEGLSGWLIFIAIGIKCGFPMLHNWLTDAYPEATPTGTVFLSAFTTKTAIYALARGYPGTELLIYVGAVMTVFPIFYAVLENDLRRVLAYSMINQLGFMVVGIGIGTAMALNGAISHAFNDVIFKGLLFMSMGVILHRVGTVRCSDLGGLYKSMPISSMLCIVGALSISAFPLFSGFVSKSMVLVAALDEGHPTIWLILLFASAGVLHHAGIKIPFYGFFNKDSGIRTTEAPVNMLLAMGLAAAVCIFNGSYPAVLYSLLPYPVEFIPYSTAHVMTQYQLLLFAVLAFWYLKTRDLEPHELPCLNLDVEWLYRRGLPRTVGWLRAVFGPLDAALRRAGMGSAERVIARAFRYHGPLGVMARTWSTGTMALWVVILLGGYLIFYYM